uniref:HTH CENPB-type domain-containing protein n=1 Tax=Labrus bergylta TaxID=56723 RepID=A0A3Q3F4S1_9LABR
PPPLAPHSVLLPSSFSALWRPPERPSGFPAESEHNYMNFSPRRSYDANFKIMVVNSAESSNNCQAAKKYGVKECNVRRWRAQKERLKDANSQRKSYRGPQNGRFGEIDRRVFEYVREKRSEGMPITRAVIQLKALEIARELNISEFKASLGWCRRMMRRNGLALRRRTSLAQHLPLDFGEKLLSFQRFVIKLRKKHSYPLDQIGNADQTPVYFDMPTSVNKKGEKSVLQTPPIWLDGNRACCGLAKGCVGRTVRGGLRKKRNMLVLDAFSGHLTEPVKSQVRAMNGDLVSVPGGMTSQLQVLDVVVNKPFKDILRKSYTEWLLSGNHALTPTRKIQKPSVRLLCEWILQAWDVVSSQSIIRGLKKCCISNALDGSEDDALWEEQGTPGGDWPFIAQTHLANHL